MRLHTADGLLHALTPAGKQLWAPAKVGEPLANAAPLVDPRGNTWLCGFGGGLWKVDPRGKLAREAFFRGRQRLDSGSVMRGDVLYVGSEEGYVLAIDTSGDRGENRWNPAGDQGHAGWYLRCWPALNDEGIVIIAGQDEHLYGFRPEGTAVFRTPMPAQMLGSPVLDRHGHIYAGLSYQQRGQQPRGSLVCVDGNSHRIRWEYNARGPVESTAVIGEDDIIYFGDNAGVIHALDLRGHPQWTAEVGSPVRSAGTILSPQRLAFGLDDQTLMVLRCGSPALATAGWPKIGRTLGQNPVI
jgi:outer membrane protein assembly factor BamB